MPTDEERMKAFEACNRAYDDAINREGIAFFLDGLQGRWIQAAIHWGNAIIRSKPDCMQLLTPEQQKQVLAKADEEFRRDWRDHHEPR